MKRVLVFLLSILVVTAFFVSCKGEPDASDKLVTIRLGAEQETLRGLIQCNEDLGDTSLEWHYSATKKSHTEFNTGATSDTKLESLSSSFALSQGKWDFKLWAIRTDGNVRVYEGEKEDVLILASNTINTIYIEVSSYISGVKGSIKLSSDIKIKKSDGTEITTKPNTLYCDNVQYTEYSSDSDYTIPNLDAGSHEIILAYKADDGDTTDIEFASETKTVNVESGRTTTISGYIVESTGSSNFNKHNISVAGSSTATITEGQDITLEVAVTPSMITDKKTSVKFPSSTLSGSEAKLSVVATPAGGNFSIVSTSSSTSIAGIDITLTVDGVEVTDFTSPITVTTYIAKGLSESTLSIEYAGSGKDDGTFVSYNKDTGELVFTTTHFSSFIASVDSNYYAYNRTTSTIYSTVQSSVDAVAQSDEIAVLKTVALEASDLITIENKKFTLDFNNVQISGTNIIKVTGSESDVTFINGNINEVNNTAIEVTNSAKLTIESGSYRSSLNLIVASDKATLNIIDGTFNAYGTAEGYIIQSLTGSIVTIDSGSFTSNLNKCMSIGLYDSNTTTDTLGGTVTINGGAFKSKSATILTHAGANLTINDGTFTSLDTADGGAVIATNEGSSNVSKSTETSGSQDYAITITINGGTFNADVTTSGKVACGLYLANTANVYLNGGTFNINKGVGVLVRRGTLYTQWDDNNKKDLKFTITGYNDEGYDSLRSNDGTIGSASEGIWIRSTSQIVVDPNANFKGLYPVACRYNKSGFTVKGRAGFELTPLYRDNTLNGTENTAYVNTHGYIDDSSYNNTLNTKDD